eukprot:Anaeramoba_ignava/c20442_g1_i2.p2 GENE.c20442_g1_i2~~c20442_g1_i2.p2  ORF type:complete len:260 (-),score=70.02 c20442_g1_i2:556-1335(-)
MPLLEAQIENLPKKIFQGSETTAILKLTNKGKIPLHNVYAKIGRPKFFVFGRRNEMGTKIPRFYEQNEEKNKNEEKTIFLEESMISRLVISERNVVKIDTDIIHPGETVSLPLWFRGATTGSVPFPFCFYYESSDPNPMMQFRIHRLLAKSQVLQSLKINTDLQFSFTSISQRILVMKIESYCKNHTLNINQISSLSPEWIIEPLNFKESSVSNKMQNPETNKKHLDLKKKHMFSLDSENQAVVLICKIIPSKKSSNAK